MVVKLLGFAGVEGLTVVAFEPEIGTVEFSDPCLEPVRVLVPIRGPVEVREVDSESIAEVITTSTT